MCHCSIVILTFNSEEDIIETIDALNQQRVDFEFEVIVADNNSQDGTVETVQSEFPDVKVLELEKNWGASVGYNKALEHTQGEYVGYLNPDTTVHEDWLVNLYEGLKSTGAAAAMSSVFEPGDEEYTPDKRRSTKETVKVKDVSPTGYIYNGEHKNPHRPIRTLHLAGNSMLFDKEVLRDLSHTFEEAFFLFADDIDIALRLNVLGYRTVQIPDAIVYHHQYDRNEPSSLKWLAKKHIWATSGRFLSFYKNMHLSEFLIALPVLVLGGVFNAKALGVSRAKKVLYAAGGLLLSMYCVGLLIIRESEVRDHRNTIQNKRTRPRFWLLKKMVGSRPPRIEWEIEN